MEVQDQIYVIAGVGAGLFLLVIAFIGYLMYRVAKISELLLGRPIEKRDTYAYNNPTIVHGEELSRRGFVMPTESRPISLNDELSSTGGLPRVDPNYGSHGGPQLQNDFSHILNNNELVFGGDRRPSKMQANAPRNQPDISMRAQFANDNLSFMNATDRSHTAPQKNYLNERMQY